MINFQELKKYGDKFYPAILLDDLIRYRNRKIYQIIMATGFLAFLFLMILTLKIDLWSRIGLTDISDFLTVYKYPFRGMALIFGILWLKSYLVEFFYLYHYFLNQKVDYEVALLAYAADPDDITGSFLESRIGEKVIEKLDLSKDEIKRFIKNKDRDLINESQIIFKTNPFGKIDDDKVVNLVDYAKAIYSEDFDFLKFLEKNNLTEDDLYGACEFVQQIGWQNRSKERFWSKENLSRIPSIGQRWYSPKINFLEKYAHLIYENKIYQSLGKDWIFFRDEAEKLEDFLLDQKFLNLLLIGKNLETSMEVISAYAKMIASGFALSKFENKRIYVLNIDVLLLKQKSAEEFGILFSEMINEAIKNRNIILVVNDLPKLIEKSDENGFDFISEFNKILSHDEIIFIATSTQEDYHSALETNVDLLNYFDKYFAITDDEDFLRRAIFHEADIIQNSDKVNISYLDVKKIINSISTDENPIKQAKRKLYEVVEKKKYESKK